MSGEVGLMDESGLRALPAPEVSIVIPMYNEEGNVAPLCDAIREALLGWPRSYEVLLVEDGSTDETLEQLRAAARVDPHLRVLALKRNSGQTLAMATGFRHARGRVIVSMDGDLQNDPRDIPRMVARLDEGFDVVCGWRKDRQDAFFSRTFPSRIANFLIAWLTGIPIHDNGCSLKAYRAEVIRSLNLYAEMHRFLPALASMTGARIDEIVVRHHPRVHGQSKYGISRTFKVLGDMITIKMITQFSSRPGLWFGLLSLPFLVLGVLAGVVWAVDVWVFDHSRTMVFTSLTIMFLYLFGHMLALSLLSEAFLANVDHRYLHRLAQILTVATPIGGGRVRTLWQEPVSSRGGYE